MSLELKDQFVKRGLWTDLDKGPVMGKTITTDIQTGNLVVAIVAVVSTLGTAHLWHLITFAYHQTRATGRSSDGLFRQQQALLRTLPPPSSVMTDAFKLWWNWRKVARRPFLQSWLLIGIATIFAAATIAASIGSSFIVAGGVIDVLVDSPFCGGFRNSSALFRSRVQDYAPSFADICYQIGKYRTRCQVFMQPWIDLTATNAPCPFIDTDWCDTSEALDLDTGLLDLGNTFGLNLEAKDRMQFRRKTTCSVLPIEGAYDVMNVTDHPTLAPPHRSTLPGEQVVLLNYGPTFSKAWPAATMVLSLLLSNATSQPTTSNGREYLGDPEAGAGWFPKKGLRIEDDTGDIFYKIVMPNAVTYGRPIDDPLYAAHRLLQVDNTTTIYLPDHPVKVVGCAQQHQLCHARKGKEDFCTPLQGRKPYLLRPGIDFPEANSMQFAMMKTFLEATWLFSTAFSKRLASVQIMTGDRIETMRNGFWTTEVYRWEQEALVSLQIAMAYYAIGPQTLDTRGEGTVWAKPETAEEKAQCTIQKMKSLGGFVNINVFGLVFVLTASVLFLIIDLSLLKFLIYLSRFRRALGPRIERWIQDGVWQLQRRAYEGEGHRNWTHLEAEIPLTEKADLLKDLPILWVPGKSPMMLQTSTFGTAPSESQEALRPPTGANAIGNVEEQKCQKGEKTYVLETIIVSL